MWLIIGSLPPLVMTAYDRRRSGNPVIPVLTYDIARDEEVRRDKTVRSPTGALY